MGSAQGGPSSRETPNASAILIDTGSRASGDWRFDPGKFKLWAMATPTLSKTTVPGALGPLFVDVRSANRHEPGPAVIVLHGFKGFKDWGMFPAFAERLARAGFTAVSFNLSGSGVDDAGQGAFPERFGHNTFATELRDLDTVLAALDAGQLGVVRPSSVGIMGHSRGGGMAILWAAARTRVKALVTWAAIATVRRWTTDQCRTWRAAGRLDIVNVRTQELLPLYPDTLDEIEALGGTTLDIEAAAARVAVPWLLAHGSADEAVPLAEAHRLVQAARPGMVEPLIIEAAGHTFGATHPLTQLSPHLDHLFTASIAHLSRALT